MMEIPRSQRNMYVSWSERLSRLFARRRISFAETREAKSLCASRGRISVTAAGSLSFRFTNRTPAGCSPTISRDELLKPPSSRYRAES